MAPVKKAIPPDTIVAVFKIIYTALRPWLYEMAKKTDSPVDDWMLNLLDTLFGLTT